MTIEEFKKQEIARMVKEGKNLTEIAKSLGVTKQAVSLWMKKYGYVKCEEWVKKQ